MIKKQIRLSKSVLSHLEKEAVMNVLDKEFLGMGHEVHEFEQLLEKYFQRKVTCVVNGTAALHLALQACGIGVGDEVLIQSITYIASLQAITATGAKPIFCDIDPNTVTLKVSDLKNKLTTNTKAIMPVHFAGGGGNLDQIYDFAKNNNLRVIEDAAHAFGTIYQKKRIGSFGDIACFSFDGIKNITSGEGGCIVTNDKLIVEKIKDSRLLGVEKDSYARYKGERSWIFDVKEQGWRYHMSNIMAAIGIVQLQRFDEFQKIRKDLSKFYTNLLIHQENIKLIKTDLDNTVMHIFPILVKNSFFRNKLREHLFEKGIQTGLHYYPNHLLTFYKSNENNLLNTMQIYEKLITLPLHPDLEVEDIEYIVNEVNNFFESIHE